MKNKYLLFPSSKFFSLLKVEDCNRLNIKISINQKELRRKNDEK